MKSNIKNTKGPKKAGPPPAPKPKGQIGTRKFLEQFNQHPNINYGLFQRKSDGKIFEWEEFLELFNNQQTTSQHQTIERLREELKESNIILNSLRLSMSVHPDNKPDSEFRGLVSLSYNQIIKVQQLLNTTEPNKTV